MKFLFLFLALISTLISALLSGPLYADPPAVHGMLVVGEKKIYLSHLPMFHPPHDYQVIFEASFTPAALATYIAAKHSAPAGTIFTLVPEPFELDRMIQSPKPFHAVLYQGHFERGGVPITSSVEVGITKVLFSKHLNPEEARPESIGYILFGSPGEYFLAHLITGEPNFDQIIAATPPKPIADGSIFMGSFSGVSDLTPPAMSQLQEGFSGLTQIYLETGDLAM
jgi:hypothetical protein